MRTEEEIDKRAIEILDNLYKGYGSGYGVLFGIPSSLKPAIYTIIGLVLHAENKCD